MLDATISNVTFSTSTSVTADGVLIDPLTVTNNPGFQFSIGSGIAGSATISFTITAPSNNPMTDASLELDFFSGTSPSPTASEMLSNGSSLSTSTSSTSDSATFAATTSLNVTDTFSVNAEGFQVQFSQTPGVAVPEPSSLALLGIGLPALGLMRRRKHP